VGESCYEAILFLAQVVDVCGSLDVDRVRGMETGQFWQSPRGLVRLAGNLVDQDVYLARAVGLEFQVADQIARAH
jgi:hypothetical protein